jgi:nucleotide-binding universal stress UspA family protein
MHFNTILLPTDFSETADHAEAEATAIARRHRSRLELFHVVEPYGEPPQHMMAVVRDYLEKLEREAEETLASKAEAIRAAGIDVSYSKSHHVPPFEAIADKVTRTEPDLVVIGTHGRRGFQHLVLGSVAEKLLRSVPATVLTVSVNTPPIGNDREFARILVPVDFSEPSSHALEAAFSLLADDGVLYLMHVVHTPAHPSFYPNPFAPSQADAQLTSDIRMHLTNWIGGRRAEPLIRIGDPARQILEAREETETELIVMGTRGLTGLTHLLIGSVTDKVVRRSQVAVLTVH